MWRRSHIDERIAGDQRQRRLRRGIEDIYVIGSDDPGLGDLVAIERVAGFVFERVADLDVPQRPERSVAMAGDTDVARLSGKRRVFDVSRSPAQRRIVAAFEHRIRDHQRAAPVFAAVLASVRTLRTVAFSLLVDRALAA